MGSIAKPGLSLATVLPGCMVETILQEARWEYYQKRREAGVFPPRFLEVVYFFRMRIVKELTKLLQTTVQQLTASNNQTSGSTSIDTREPYFTKKFEAKAKSWGLTEADAKDVLYHGASTRENMLVRKYNGYEIGIYYFKDTWTGQTVISSIWKRERR